jgi:hypothetical protein
LDLASYSLARTSKTECAEFADDGDFREHKPQDWREIPLLAKCRIVEGTITQKENVYDIGIILLGKKGSQITINGTDKIYIRKVSG